MNVQHVVRAAAVSLPLILLTACGGGDGHGAGSGPAAPTSFTITIATSGNGEGSTSPGSATVDRGSTASFTVDAMTGSSLAEASGCGGTLEGNVYTTGPISGDCTITVRFDLDTYEVAASSGSGGTVAP